MTSPDDILEFWFPPGLDDDEETHRRQFQWWFRGGADQVIVERFTVMLELAAQGQLDHWSEAPRSRLALIVVLDQFSRATYRDTARAYAQDEKALALALDGLDRGHYGRLASVWEKTFFSLPLGHSEQLLMQERNVTLCEALVREAPDHLRTLYEFSASQARGHRDVIARFGRHPHRNAVLGRTSTEDEQRYLASGQIVHRRAFPS